MDRVTSRLRCLYRIYGAEHGATLIQYGFQYSAVLAQEYGTSTVLVPQYGLNTGRFKALVRAVPYSLPHPTVRRTVRPASALYGEGPERCGVPYGRGRDLVYRMCLGIIWILPARSSEGAFVRSRNWNLQSPSFIGTWEVILLPAQSRLQADVIS